MYLSEISAFNLYKKGIVTRNDLLNLIERNLFTFRHYYLSVFEVDVCACEDMIILLCATSVVPIKNWHQIQTIIAIIKLFYVLKTMSGMKFIQNRISIQFNFHLFEPDCACLRKGADSSCAFAKIFVVNIRAKIKTNWTHLYNKYCIFNADEESQQEYESQFERIMSKCNFKCGCALVLFDMGMMGCQLPLMAPSIHKQAHKKSQFS